jgi:hypothetical protein
MHTAEEGFPDAAQKEQKRAHGGQAAERAKRRVCGC